MEKTINKIIICIILIYCYSASSIGQNNDGILLKYSLLKTECKKMEKPFVFPSECFRNNNYMRMVDFDTIYYKTDTLFIVLPDNRKIVERNSESTFAVVGNPGLHPLKKVFNQFIPIQAEEKIVVLKCNWYIIVFEKKKGNKYKLSKVYEEDFFDYINSIPLQNSENKVTKN